MRIRILILIGSMFILFACENGQKKANKQGEALQQGPSKNQPNETKENTSRYLISSGQVGTFKIGDDIPYPSSAKTYEVRKKQQKRFLEGGPVEETIYIVSEDGAEVLTLKPKYDHEKGTYADKIGEIIVVSEKYKTKEGIGVNATVAEFQSTYPDFKMWYTYVSDRYVIEASKLPAQFLLNEKDFIGEMKVNSAMVTLKKGDFKEGAKIIKVRVFK